MFEEEVKLEKESFNSSFFIILLLIIAIGVGIAFWMFRAKKDLTADDAAAVLTSSVKRSSPAQINFTVGMLTPSVKEKPRDPHYKLLEKIGFIKVKDLKKDVNVTLTPLGEHELGSMPEVQKAKNTDGTVAYGLPLAHREFVKVDKVEMTGPNTARVRYFWKWVPNKVGEKFDTESPEVRSFSQWDRATLIKSYGVDFYKNAEPKVETVNMLRGSKGWEITNLE